MCDPSPISQTFVLENESTDRVVLILQQGESQSFTLPITKVILHCNADEQQRPKKDQDEPFEHNYATPWDVKVIVNDSTVTYGIHKFLLNLASPLWEQQLNNCQSQVNGKYVVKLDVSGSTFEMVKYFLYTSFIPFGMNMTKALRVLEASCTQNISVIKEPISNWIQDNLRSVSVAIRVLQTARINRIEKLIYAALGYISRHSQAAFNSKEFLNLDVNCVRYILSSDNLACNEMAVFDAVLKWATEKAKGDAHMSPKKSLKLRLDEVINCVRFPLMSSSEISRVLRDLPVCPLSNYNQEQIMNNLLDPRTTCFNSSPRVFNH